VLKQREALGVDFTQGSIEDTDELEQLLSKIITEFKLVVLSMSTAPLN
jgi:two-component system OmpR family sensor kinase